MSLLISSKSKLLRPPNIKCDPLFRLPPENGYLQKAVNYDGEMHIIEEVKLFQNAEPVDVLRLHQNQVRRVQDL